MMDAGVGRGGQEEQDRPLEEETTKRAMDQKGDVEKKLIQVGLIQVGFSKSDT